MQNLKFSSEHIDSAFNSASNDLYAYNITIALLVEDLSMSVTVSEWKAYL